jgi:predicted membrane-bound spermidine synthase
MAWFFVFFFISGFCSILYEIVWLRLAMAQFGITSPLASIVLSMFMAGLGLGSWASGRLIRRYEARITFPPLRFYALTELLIGMSALLVPSQLALGRRLLEHVSISSSWAYYLSSGLWIALTLIPWCACMGATIPLAMWAIRVSYSQNSRRSFSYLYLANVLGAVAGAVLPLLLIETRGFHGTLRVGAVLNGLLALTAVLFTLRKPAVDRSAADPIAVPVLSLSGASNPSALRSWGGRKPLVLLFFTGLTSMGLELVWIRQFTPYLNTVVYAFAAILAVYLSSTYLGSQVYRIWSRKTRQENRLVWMLLGLFALLPLLAANPHFFFLRSTRLALGIAPFSGVLGFVTPMLVDRWSGGDPDKAGRAYAVNVAGCIFGPLLSGFLLLPYMSERWVLCAFSLPWLVLGVLPGWLPRQETAQRRLDWQMAVSYVLTLVAGTMLFTSTSFEDQFTFGEILRDNTATIIATGQGMHKRLLVNGVGITGLSPVTKSMAHLPLAFLDHPPQNALVVCFGMGTTYRSLLSWGVPTTAVELVPSVPRMIGYYHADGPSLLHSPLSHVVIDDGRRYLERTFEQYDVITLDPPPPVEAAGSSLLYSKEFYVIIQQRLRPDGILQQWLPMGDAVVHAAVARALKESFPYIRVFHSVDGWGYHFLASRHPLPNWTAAELAQHMPPRAAADLTEWGPQPTPEGQFAQILKNEISVDQMIAEAPDTPALQDDHPENEYYAIRRQWLRPARWYLIW